MSLVGRRKAACALEQGLIAHIQASRSLINAQIAIALSQTRKTPANCLGERPRKFAINQKAFAGEFISSSSAKILFVVLARQKLHKLKVNCRKSKERREEKLEDGDDDAFSRLSEQRDEF